MHTYTHSGKVPIGGAIVTLLGGVIAAVVGGVLYAYAFHWLGVIWFLRVVFAFFFALLVGTTIATLANWGKIRSALFVTLVAFVCSAIGLWVYWGAYQWARQGPEAGLHAWSPGGLLDQGQDLFANGSRVFKKSVVRGWPLVGIWIAEALSGWWLVTMLARSDAQRPFCEACERWTDATKGLMLFAANGHEPAWREVLSGDLPAIAEFPLARGAQPMTVRLDLASCPSCEQSSYLTLTSLTTTTDNKGKTKTTERALIVNGVLTAVEAEFLRQFAQQIKDQAATEATGNDEDDEDDEAETAEL
ncbi:MAG: hypothetical protein SFU86_18065 [Pirellulaceae bacterium]|nr:hypothetical protein [Pirellulaceae bacterium]